MKEKKDSLYSENPLIHSEFPFLSLEIKEKNCTPPRVGFNTLHWHDDLQFILVIDGVVIVQTPSLSYTVRKNEGFFINKKVIHKIYEERECHYRSFIFPQSLIEPCNHSLNMEYINSYTQNPLLECFLISEINPTRSDLKRLNDIVTTKNNDEFYQFRVIAGLMNLWSSFIQNINIEKRVLSSLERKRSQRIQSFVSFIHHNYHLDISLSDIAKSANVSSVECSRIFESTLSTTPYEYLINYRIKKSMELLRDTSYGIAQIATKVGYNSSSHFGKFFKRKLGMTPNRYRKAVQDTK